MALLLFLAGVAALSLPARDAASTENSVARMRPMLGTYVEITVRGLDTARANRAIDAGFAAIAEVDRLLSSHRPDSELNAINAAAGERAIAVSPWTWECLARSVEIGRASDGAFDVTCRPMLDLWGFVQKQGYRVPTRAELEAVRPLVDYRNILLLPSDFSTRALATMPWPLGQPRVGLLRPGMQLDVGGIGKGFAADKAVAALRAAGASAGLVRCWGDLRAFGARPWRVGIADPDHPARAVVEFDLANEALSTSGNYENFFMVGGHHYAHIINPRTGQPIENYRSISVRAPEGALADAWCKALLVNPRLRPPAAVRLADTR